MQIISDFKKTDKLKKKIDSFLNFINTQSFFLLIKPNSIIYSNQLEKNQIDRQIENLISAGLKNLEISWSENQNWKDYVSKLKEKFPQINLGSASINNRKSIDESVEIGLAYSMMKFWDKDLINYAKAKNHLLIPGIKNIKDFKEAIDLNCKIIKIYPVKSKDKRIDISKYKKTAFIAAGNLSISDHKQYKCLGYKAIVIGDKVFINKDIDPKIHQFLT